MIALLFVALSVVDTCVAIAIRDFATVRNVLDTLGCNSTSAECTLGSATSAFDCASQLSSTQQIACDQSSGLVQEMSFQFVYLGGRISTLIGMMTGLTRLALTNVNLTGVVPTQLGLLTALTYLAVSLNSQISSTLPSEIGALERLESLILNTNQLFGTVPSQLSKLQNLTTLTLFGNMLVGKVPLLSVKLGVCNLQVNAARGNCFDIYTGGCAQKHLNGRYCNCDPSSPASACDDYTSTTTAISGLSLTTTTTLTTQQTTTISASSGAAMTTTSVAMMMMNNGTTSSTTDSSTVLTTTNNNTATTAGVTTSSCSLLVVSSSTIIMTIFAILAVFD